jgi:hypothetical protein
MAAPGPQKPLVDFTDGELVMLALSILLGEVSGRVAKVSISGGQKIASLSAECRKRSGVGQA